MTTQRTATAEWKGDLPSGKGNISTESGAIDTPYDFPSRFQEGDRTNPEELIGAAHAGCFSMALANLLAEEGYDPESIRTDATVHLDPDGPSITRVDLETIGRVPDIDEAAFLEIAEKAKAGCPVSGALAAIEITLDAKLRA